VSDPAGSARALRQRLAAHARGAALDINDWIFAQVRPRPGERALDVGCGTGHQLLRLAAAVRPGLALGLDSSLEALREASLGAGGTALLVGANMEALDRVLSPVARFDLVLCCFALYYSSDPAATVEAIRARLSPGGRGFVCGPARENNREFIELCASVVPPSEQPFRREGSLVFMDETAPPLLRRWFGRVEESAFVNPVTFREHEDLVAYWRSYHLYAPAYEARFRDALAERFRDGPFVTRKVVRGLLVS
jgi:SAM-dependent methyltransferase